MTFDERLLNILMSLGFKVRFEPEWDASIEEDIVILYLQHPHAKKDEWLNFRGMDFDDALRNFTSSMILIAWSRWFGEDESDD